MKELLFVKDLMAFYSSFDRLKCALFFFLNNQKDNQAGIANN